MGSIVSIVRRPVPLFANTLRDRSGGVAVLLAIALSLIIGFAGLGTEAASWYLTKRTMQAPPTRRLRPRPPPWRPTRLRHQPSCRTKAGASPPSTTS
jgi:hypothetical protein